MQHSLPQTEVLILMATYNGEVYVSQQIESIISQSFEHWHLLIRDDGSVDKTSEIIAQYSRKDPRIEILSDEIGNTGNAAKCFGRLLHSANEYDFNYLMFSDQDDVWDETKIARFLDEAKAPRILNSPLLLHSDLRGVDEHLNPLFPSFIQRMGLHALSGKGQTSLYCQNSVTGCAAFINKPLFELINPLPECVAMHDWWIALVANKVGEVRYIDTPTVSYRQHSGNVVGAMSSWGYLNIFNGAWFKALGKSQEAVFTCYKQVLALKQRLGNNNFSSIPIEDVELFLTSVRYNRVKRIFHLVRHGFHPVGLVYFVGFVFRHLLVSRKKLEIEVQSL